MINFCTLFDSGYLSRGLVLYESLLKNCSNFHLYILAFDDLAFEVLSKLNFKNVTVIALNEFEDPELLAVKSNRSRAEYCWTTTPSIIKYCITNFKLDHCIYVDADMMFFNDPQLLLNELKENQSIIITSHRYSKEYNSDKTSGKYCVQFMFFKNDKNGMEALSWWRDRCIEWCFARFEDGKFGDQKYLDDWPTRFLGVCELAHLGGGVAPWNMQQYDFELREDKVFLKQENVELPLVFFHYHNLKFQLPEIDLGTYKVKNSEISLIYKPYLQELTKVEKSLKQLGYQFNWHANSKKIKNIKNLILKFKRKLRNRYYVFKFDEIVEWHI